MTSPVVWAILWWACYHVTWLETMRQSAQMSPQEQIDGAINRALRQMGNVRDLRQIKHGWEDE